MTTPFYTGSITFTAPYVAFTDATGSCTISLSVPHIDSWTPDSMDIKNAAVSLGTGLTYTFIYRRDYYATFELPHLNQSQIPCMLRLKTWLESGGQAHVVTYDSISNTYDFVIWPTKTVDITFSDRKMQQYTLTIPAKNVVNSPMYVNYSGL